MTSQHAYILDGKLPVNDRPIDTQTICYVTMLDTLPNSLPSQRTPCIQLLINTGQKANFQTELHVAKFTF